MKNVRNCNYFPFYDTKYAYKGKKRKSDYYKQRSYEQWSACIFSGQFLSSLNISPGVGMLDHKEALFLFFKEISTMYNSQDMKAT